VQEYQGACTLFLQNAKDARTVPPVLLEDLKYILIKIINIIDDEKPVGIIIAGDINKSRRCFDTKGLGRMD
jgi:hypothetical protein